MVSASNVIAAPVIAAMGNFDGVHLGHQYLLKETAAFARAHGAAPGVVLFEPHPRRFFRPGDPPFLLTAPSQRDRLLREAGAEAIYSVTFDRTLASMSPAEFVKDVLKDRLGLKGVVAGADFRFGKDRAGDGAALKRLSEAAGLEARLIDVLKESPQTEKFGSSAVRAALQSGEVEKAATMLGRPWSVVGAVAEGAKVGRTIGFPTANMTLGELIEPRKGVYAVRASVDGETYNAVANFGRRPTVGSEAPLLETYLFDFDGDLYGKEMEVAFIAFLRDEQKFDGLDALKAQIAEDCVRAKSLLG
ncbi:bifunctional riboflavin kinase/FAD synthetase [Hyphococcus luteus]|uniref:Riboflavin biosynthesis protein n=1 Tax=Hyphococcus luteus TaxID=2058213 RepID=A0A2S7K7K4_9PROT|nr:bifunctional riboflavin kinase/FAD synthetase [Marinicaulis flavus]PQA88476.1 bifunctional riboflavin kinase/FMN adenylyltransferase [Marinicaulis flavus]